MDFGLKRSPLAACVLALATCGFVGCPSTPITPPGPVDTDETARLGNDEQLATARALALKGTPSPAPELDLLVKLAEAATPELGLEALVGAGGKAPIPTLVPGDAVEIGVFGYESYTGVTQVSPEGEVAITAVGSVKAVGLTTSQLAKAVAIVHPKAEQVHAGLEAQTDHLVAARVAEGLHGLLEAGDEFLVLGVADGLLADLVERPLEVVDGQNERIGGGGVGRRRSAARGDPPGLVDHQRAGLDATRVPALRGRGLAGRRGEHVRGRGDRGGGEQ